MLTFGSGSSTRERHEPDGLLRARWADVAALLMLAVLAVILFRHHLSGTATFVGSSDRLNVAFAERKYNVDMIHQAGSVPTWNETMFMGFSTYGNVYTPMVNDPLAYLLALFPVQQLAQVWGVMAFLLLLLIAWSAYLYIKDVCGSPLAAFVGGSVYAFSAYSTLRVGQVDPVAATLVQMPLGLLMLRRAEGRWAPVWLLGLLAVMLTLFQWSFAQEAAYAVILFGCYALYRAVMRRSLWPLVYLSVATAGAALLASARLYAFYENSRGLGRTSTFITTCSCEVIRWFNDGIFGRYPEEVARVGNQFNLHEGFQLYSSTFTALLLLVGIALPWIWLRASDSEAPFHVLMVISVFLVVLVEPVRYLVYLIFMQSDLLHSRYTSAGLVSVALLAAVFSGQLVNHARPRLSGRSLILTLLAATIVAICVLWLIDRLAASRLTAMLGLNMLPQIGGLPTVRPPYRIVDAEAAKTIWAIVLFIVGAGVWWICGRINRGSSAQDATAEETSRKRGPVASVAGLVHRTAPYTLMALLVAQGFQHAAFQYSGPHTWTFPVPFKQNNSFMAPAGAFRPPAPATQQAVRERLETDKYRSVAVMEPGGFPLYGPAGGLEYASHLSELWELRLIQGYPGIGRRFASLPWQGAANTRSLYFPAGGPLPWELLALLNVKYAVTVNPALYYNLAGGDPSSGAEAGLADVQVVENPLPVVPRHFFTRAVRPVAAGDVSALLPRDPAVESLVEGAMTATTFPAEGRIEARYASDRIDVRVEPSTAARFLVLNEGYDAQWRAVANGQDLPIIATNVVMRGLVVPPGVTEIQLRFEPSGPGFSLGMLQRRAADRTP